MARFQTKLKNARYSLSQFGAEQMAAVGKSALDSIFSRWDSAVDVYDLAARPLAEGYAKRKANKGLQPVRNLLFSGRLRRSLKVISASPNRCVIGPVGGPIYKRKGVLALTAADVLILNNRRHRMWGISPRDKQAIIQAFLRERNAIRSRVA